MLTFSNEDARGVVAKQLGDEAAQEVKSLDFQPFPEYVHNPGRMPHSEIGRRKLTFWCSLEQAVRADIEYLRSSKVVSEGTTFSGWVYDVKTGKTERLV